MSDNDVMNLAKDICAPVHDMVISLDGQANYDRWLTTVYERLKRELN